MKKHYFESLLIHLIVLMILYFVKFQQHRLPVTWLEFGFGVYYQESKTGEKTGGGEKVSYKTPKQKEEELAERIKALEEELKGIEKKWFSDNKGLEGIELEGQISAREILYYTLPEGVPLLRDVSLRFHITVSPKGDVLKVVVIKKGPPELERLTLEHLKRWKFNPLPPDLNAMQDGYVTIHFKLK